MDKMWFYALRGRDRQGPVTESDLKNLIANGQVAPTDLAWTEGMATWTAVRDIADLQSVAPATKAAPAPEAAATERTTPPAPPAYTRPQTVATAAAASVGIPDGLLGWTGFVAVMNIIGGVLSCLSCIGIVYGIFLLLSGVSLQAAKTSLQGITSVDPAMLPFLEKLRSAMKMIGLFYIVSLVFTVIVIIIYAGVFIAALSAGTLPLPE